MHANICKCYRIFGKVQGVFFRAETKKIADKLKLTGFVRNELDGSVEVVACGSLDNHTALYLWLKKGPTRAKVTNVTVEDLAWQFHREFVVLR